MGTAERLNPQARKTQQALPVEALDGFGRPLVQGDVVLMKDTAGMLWNVTGVVPEVDPRLPSNLVRLELSSRRVLRVRATQVTSDVVRVKTAAEAGAPPSELQFFAPRAAWWERWLRLGR